MSRQDIILKLKQLEEECFAIISDDSQQERFDKIMDEVHSLTKALNQQPA